MTEKLTKVQDIFLDRINQICRKFGLNNVMAQLYAILYFSNKRLSLDDMVERLKISKGGASVNIRALERYGVVRKVWVKGSRKDYYEAEGDIYKVIMDRARSMAQGRLSDIENMLNSCYQAMDSINPSDEEEIGAVKIFRERLDKFRDLKNKAQSLFNLLNSNMLNNIFTPSSRKNSKAQLVM